HDLLLLVLGQPERISRQPGGDAAALAVDDEGRFQRRLDALAAGVDAEDLGQAARGVAALQGLYEVEPGGRRQERRRGGVYRRGDKLRARRRPDERRVVVAERPERE